IRTETSPFAVMEKPMSPDPSPSTDCRTPTKKPKRPPYAVYNDDSEDDIRHSSCSRDLHLSPPPSLTIQGIVDPIRIRLFSTKDDDIEKMDNNIDQDCDNDHIFFRRSPIVKGAIGIETTADERYCIPLGLVEGRALLRIWPLTRFGLIKN
ncbi:unnamed protein product, partial [Didymodactylos carnosus]